MNKVNNADPCQGPEGDCNKAETLVDKYIDGILNEEEKSFISKHLVDCPGCNHGFEFESSFHVRIQSMAPIHMPNAVKENILMALGFPGLSEPMKGSFSALGSIDASIEPDISSNFGIPKGTIPQGEIPRNSFFTQSGDTSMNNDSQDD